MSTMAVGPVVTTWHPPFVIEPEQTIDNLVFDGWEVTDVQVCQTALSTHRCPAGVHVFLSMRQSAGQRFSYRLRAVTRMREIAAVFRTGHRGLTKIAGTRSSLLDNNRRGRMVVIFEPKPQQEHGQPQESQS